MTNSDSKRLLREILRPALEQWESRVDGFATNDILTDLVSVLEPYITSTGALYIPNVS